MFDIIGLVATVTMALVAILTIAAVKWRQLTLDHQLKHMQEQEKIDQANHVRWMEEQRLQAELALPTEVRLAELATGKAQAEQCTAEARLEQERYLERKLSRYGRS